MAFDALRLRNIIQLIGILGTLLLHYEASLRCLKTLAAFHLAMMVFASLQVHQTKTALINPTCDQTPNTLVGCPSVVKSFHFNDFTALWWTWVTLATCATFPDCRAMHYCCFVVLYAVLDQKALLGIWVRSFKRG